MRAAIALAFVLAACGSPTPSIATAPGTVTLHSFTIAGSFPTGWTIENDHGARQSWLLEQRDPHRVLARLDLDPVPCIGLPCSGDTFRDLIVAQNNDDRNAHPETQVELPFEEIRHGVYRSADRRPARQGPGDEIEFNVIYTKPDTDAALDCGGYARGPQVAQWRQLLDLCLAIDITWTPAPAGP